MLTAKQIQSDFLGFVNTVQYAHASANKTLAQRVNGKVYRAGLRPRDSRKEDITVAFLTGREYDYATGFVVISIYVPDLRPYKDNGVWVEDMKRTAELEAAAAAWVEALTAGKTPGYLVDPDQTISTEDDAEINQHFVCIRLRYNYYNK